MGLDMYLSKKNYIGNKWKKPSQLVKVVVPKIEKETTPEIDNKRISEITEEMGYWRKANAIHNWFVQKVQYGKDDCKEHYVEREKLEELLNIVNKVLESSELVVGKIKNGSKSENGIMVDIIEDGKYIKDPKVAMELLPTTQGFFFGNLDYNEFYYRGLEETKKILEGALKEKVGDFYYNSSW